GADRRPVPRSTRTDIDAVAAPTTVSGSSSTERNEHAMRTSHLRYATLAVLALALPLAACGSDDDSSSDTTAGSAAPADTTAESAAPAESTPAESTPADSAAPADSTAGGAVPDGPTITIGAQDFGESAILSQVYGQALEAAGYPISQQALGGFRDIVFSSFDSGDI